MLESFYLALLIFFSHGVAHSVEVSDDYTPFQQKVKDRWARFYPYVPERREYNIEIGSMYEERNQYWLGASMGFHIGRCIFSRSQSCQQFTDLIGGVGGRDGMTNGTFLSSVRWQFTDLSDNYATHARIFIGGINHNDDFRDGVEFTYGMGFGITTSVHDRLDLRLETRLGQADRPWGQTFLALSLKFDRWVDYFAEKLESMGVAGKLIKGTAEVTGNVIQGTIETTGKVLKGTVETTVDAVDATGSALKKGRDKATEFIQRKEKDSNPPEIGE